MSLRLSLGLVPKLFVRRRLMHLRNKVLNEEDKLLFDEASRCLIAGANRSAYVTTWLCAAASIRSKIESIAPRDSHVGNKLGEIEEAESKGKPIDRLLLDAAKEFGFIPSEDFDNLENIRRMRNIYAHPRRSAPIPDEVLGAMGAVVRSLLSKPALLRHGYASEIIRGIFEERHFLDDVEDRILGFGQDFAKRLDPQVYPWVFKSAIDRLENIWDDITLDSITARSVSFLHGFLIEAGEYFDGEDWKFVEMVSRYPKTAPVILAYPEIWSNIPFQAREIIIGYLAEALRQPGVSPGYIGPLPSQAFDAIKRLEDADMLSERESERFRDALIHTPLERLAQYGIPLQDWVDRLLESLKSYDWYTQNPAIDALWEAGPEQVSYLTGGLQEELGRNILQSADGGAHSAEFLMREIERRPNRWPPSFLGGLVRECFLHESGVHRTKCRMMAPAIRSICVLPQSAALEILDDLIEDLGTSLPKDDDFASFDFEEAVETIDAVEEEFSIFDEDLGDNIVTRLRRLTEVLRRLEEARLREIE